MTSFSKEELAVQSIVNGQADLGVGTPYSVIQKSKVPLKVVFQMSRLVYFPVASIEYKTWKDLDGQPFTFHARGTGTEAIVNNIATLEGIKFGQRSYFTGPRHRLIAMMKRQSTATRPDRTNRTQFREQGG